MRSWGPNQNLKKMTEIDENEIDDTLTSKQLNTIAAVQEIMEEKDPIMLGTFFDNNIIKRGGRTVDEMRDIQAYLDGAIAHAVSNNQPELIPALVYRGAHVDIPDENGDTRLHVAVSVQYKRVVEELIVGGADVNAVNNDGVPILHYAMEALNLEILELLLDAGADPRKRDGITNETPTRLLYASLFMVVRGDGRIDPKIVIPGYLRAIDLLESYGAEINTNPEIVELREEAEEMIADDTEQSDNTE